MAMLAVSAVCLLAVLGQTSALELLVQDDSVVLKNGYVSAVFDLQKPGIFSLQADFFGQGQYGDNVLASGGIVLEREDGDGRVHASSDGAIAGGVQVAVLSNTSTYIAVSLSSIVDDAQAPCVSETWVLSLYNNSRSLLFNTTGATTRAVVAMAVRHAFYWQPQSVYALFDRGTVQMMNAPGSADFFGSADTLSRIYAMGGNHSIDILRQTVSGPVQKTVVLSSEGGSPYWGGLHVLLAGDFDRLDHWDIGWKGEPARAIPAGQRWAASAAIAPNNFDFPVADLTTGPNLFDRDLRAMLSGIYGSPVGCLCTYDNAVAKGVRVGQIAPSIHHPSTAYGNTYNYFDPDNWIGLTAMMYSGSRYLQEQARVVIERSGSLLKPSGQLPHHFEGIVPTYIALSGATQTGPNLFWTLTALRYAKESGNNDWLRGYMPILRSSVGFLLNLIDPHYKLLYCPGSLMIDVFIRQQLTSDSNAMMVALLREFAEAELYMNNTSRAAELNTIADTIITQMNNLLWAYPDNDHFITQRNTDNTTRDFVDYDANLIAVANKVATGDRATRLLKRVDSGRCTHGRATFVSELYYGPKDCFNGNVGDSWCSMARIGLFDSYARKVVGDQPTFDNLILNPLREDVIQYTWLRERYYCDGTQELNRTQYYFEYPAFVAMAVREVRYGVNLGLRTVSISPFGPASFNFHVGNINVDYSPVEIVLNLPGNDVKVVTIDNLTVNANYVLSATGSSSCSVSPSSIRADATGSISFNAFINSECTITASRSG